MLNGLKIIKLIPRKGIKPVVLLLIIILAELLLLAGLTWLIFKN